MLLPTDVIWIFDGRDGVGEMLAELVAAHLRAVELLVPPSALREVNDPLEAWAVDEGFRALERLDSTRLERLFPPAVDEALDPDHIAREAMVRSRATTMHAHAREVLAGLERHGAFVPVTEEQSPAWLQTFGALRVALHADLAGSPSRLAEPTRERIDEHPALAAVLDWLAYNIEDLLETRSACLSVGAGLDISEIEEWE